MAIIEVMDACQDGRFVHTGAGHYIIDRNGNDVIIGFDGKRTLAGVHQEGRTNMTTYYNLRKYLQAVEVGADNYHTTGYFKSNAQKFIDDARAKNRILYSDATHTVVLHSYPDIVLWIDINYVDRFGMVKVTSTNMHGSWRYLQANGNYELAKALERFHW
jgi:hypothetical protein